MHIKEFDEGVIIKNIKYFHPIHTFECGQCFRWDKTEEDSYIGVAHDRVLEVALRDKDLHIYNTNLEEFNHLWIDYFDLRRDYGAIQRELAKDKTLKEAIPHGRGIRLLNQDEWETLVSFIISANKNIPHIKIIINRLCENYGQPIEYKGKIYYSFPRAQDLLHLSVDEIAQTKCGYRAKYIHRAIEKVGKEDFDLYKLKNLSQPEARKELLTFYGIGPKIADCILLFSMGKYGAFPTDVWVKRVMEFFYFEESATMGEIQQLAREKWGEWAGFAQQYLFYYARDKIGRQRG